MEAVTASGALAGLREEVLGDVFAPGDPAYDDARALWNGMAEARPAVIVGRSVQDRRPEEATCVVPPPSLRSSSRS